MLKSNILSQILSAFFLQYSSSTQFLSFSLSFSRIPQRPLILYTIHSSYFISPFFKISILNISLVSFTIQIHYLPGLHQVHRVLRYTPTESVLLQLQFHYTSLATSFLLCLKIMLPPTEPTPLSVTSTECKTIKKTRQLLSISDLSL